MSGKLSLFFLLPHRNEKSRDFWIGTYGTFWVESMDTFSELAFSLIRLKPQKNPYFSKGLTAMSLIKQAF
ncbi:hypothetical protein B1L04_08735 [Microcystis aeruginosa KW]|uniref:Transposase n=1 Tax=Microcystis aeruginosa KW TaxID=1960155 RepID=A0A1V4BYA5_MICAE|nr:hypothetical protein B1L04_08735 [Microcystis aeruginosa KW]